MTDAILDTDSEDEIPAGWEERVTFDGKVYYAKYVLLYRIYNRSTKFVDIYLKTVKTLVVMCFRDSDLLSF